MKEIYSIFELSFLSADVYHEKHAHLIIVTSRDCPWCEKFKPYWSEIAESITKQYELSTLKVEDIGGERIFREGFLFFFQHDVGESIGFPSMYILDYGERPAPIPPEVFWHAGQQQFLKQNLINYLRERGMR